MLYHIQQSKSQNNLIFYSSLQSRLISTILETNLDFILYFDYNRNEVKLWIILLEKNILVKLNPL